MTFFFFFSLFWQGKGSLSPTERESHSSRAESNSCARYHSLCSCTRQQQQQSAAMTTIVESQQSHVLHKFGANVCGETSEAFCISFPTNTPLPRDALSSILLLLRWWWRRGDITIYNRYILFPRRFAPYSTSTHDHLCTQLREDIRLSTVFDERASKTKRCGIYSPARIFLRLDFETLKTEGCS